jgi:hypothetical protein
VRASEEEGEEELNQRWGRPLYMNGIGAACMAKRPSEPNDRRERYSIPHSTAGEGIDTVGVALLPQGRRAVEQSHGDVAVLWSSPWGFRVRQTPQLWAEKINNTLCLNFHVLCYKGKGVQIGHRLGSPNPISVPDRLIDCQRPPQPQEHGTGVVRQGISTRRRSFLQDGGDV